MQQMPEFRLTKPQETNQHGDSGIITLRFQQQTCPFDVSTLYVREITEYNGLHYCTVSSDHPGALIVKENSAINVIPENLF